MCEDCGWKRQGCIHRHREPILINPHQGSPIYELCSNCGVAVMKKLDVDLLREIMTRPTGKFISVMNRTDYDRLSPEDQKLVDGRDDIKISDMIPMELSED